MADREQTPPAAWPTNLENGTAGPDLPPPGPEPGQGKPPEQEPAPSVWTAPSSTVRGREPSDPLEALDHKLSLALRSSEELGMRVTTIQIALMATAIAAGAIFVLLVVRARKPAGAP